MNYLPVIIVGAPRSGTNMLRDILTSFEGIGTWPCDEINYIWRHGNLSYPSDELPSAKATNKVKSYIRGQFEKIARKNNLEIVVEKTCANTLRVPFVAEVFPEAKYIFIYRDGVDAAGSAMLRWKAKLNVPYLLEKVRFVPISDLPYYALRYLWARIYLLFSKNERLAFWGPVPDGLREILRKFSLEEICALQWQRCVDKAETGLLSMPSDKVLSVCYEKFVCSPEAETRKILEFIGVDASDDYLVNAAKGVSRKNVGKGRELLGDQQVRKIESLVGSSLKRYGYL